MLKLNIPRDEKELFRNVSHISREDTDLYKSFNEFMINPTYIRFGTNESVVTKQLSTYFNEISGRNVSHNHEFPKLMEIFMRYNPQYKITKKHRTEGMVYLGVGLATEPIPKLKTPITNIEIRAKWKEKNDLRALRKRNIADELKREIQRLTQWTDIEYQHMVNMGFITILKNGAIYNLDGIIIMATANIIAHTYNSINKLEQTIRGANSIKSAYERAITQDEELSNLHDFPTYTNRLRVAPDVNNMIDRLQREIARYNNSIVDLPKINHIVYPDIQYSVALVTWLKSHNMYQTRRDMAATQQTAVDAEEWNLEGNVVHHVYDTIFN
jgi:hypothetical protein